MFATVDSIVQFCEAEEERRKQPKPGSRIRLVDFRTTEARAEGVSV